MSEHRPKLAVRREGQQIVVVVDWPEGDKLLDCLKDGEWGDSGSPVEPVIALELLARVGESAPAPLSTVCRRIVSEAAEAMEDALTAALARIRRMN